MLTIVPDGVGATAPFARRDDVTSACRGEHTHPGDDDGYPHVVVAILDGSRAFRRALPGGAQTPGLLGV
jgi:hypothetical protein